MAIVEPCDFCGGIPSKCGHGNAVTGVVVPDSAQPASPTGREAEALKVLAEDAARALFHHYADDEYIIGDYHRLKIRVTSGVDVQVVWAELAVAFEDFAEQQRADAVAEALAGAAASLRRAHDNSGGHWRPGLRMAADALQAEVRRAKGEQA